MGDSAGLRQSKSNQIEQAQLAQAGATFPCQRVGGTRRGTDADVSSREDW